MILAPNTIPPLFHVMFTIPTVAINNAMACRVFRDIKFGYISATGTTTLRTSGLPPLNFIISGSDDPTMTIGSRRQRRPADNFELQTTDASFEQANSKEMGVHITTSVEQFSTPNDSYRVSFPHAALVADKGKV